MFKYDVPEGCKIVIKRGYVTKDDAQAEAQKSFLGLIAALLPAAGLAVALSSCDDDEKERLEAEHERALAEAEKQRDALLAMGVTHYEIIASGNDNICDRCAEMVGRAFPLDELAIGENAPPFHPNCGCTIVEYAGEGEEDGTRKPPVPPPGILGDRTENRIAELHPDIQENARMALYEMQQIWGDVRVVEAYRSPARSDSVAGSGRGVAAGRSNHNYGLAFDIGFFDENGRYMDGKNADGSKNQEEIKLLNELQQIAGEIGRKYGFEWGGDWSGAYCDPPHFQMPYGYGWRELMDLPLLEGSDYLRQVDPDRKYQPQPDGATSQPPVWER